MENLRDLFPIRYSSWNVFFQSEAHSPELDSSFLNRLTIWWFSKIPWIGARKDLEVDLNVVRGWFLNLSISARRLVRPESGNDDTLPDRAVGGKVESEGWKWGLFANFWKFKQHLNVFVEFVTFLFRRNENLRIFWIIKFSRMPF